jgi:hypothetical protein
MLFGVNVLFMWLHHMNQVRTHQSSYINAILIQSQNVLILCYCQLSDMVWRSFEMSSYIRTFWWVLQ